MNAVTELPDRANALDQFAESVVEFSQDQVSKWIELCDDFLMRQRENVVKVEPTPETLKRYRQSLKWILRTTRIMHCQMSDPDFPGRRVARDLSALLWRLEDSWNLIHEPMPDKEADMILNEVFPE